MYKINEIELDYLPRQKAMKIMNPYKDEPRMSEFDSGFLCGLLKKFRPAKVLELGVAGGYYFDNPSMLA